ncbi:MAG: HAMP domain-containing sensor histidine kinase [Pseudomonadota bacterium]
MTTNWSLCSRLTITLAIFGGVISLLLASFIYIASADLEARLIDDTLNAELDDYIARRQRNPQSLPERTATIRAYVISSQAEATQIPAAVRQLNVGLHDLSLEGISYRAGVRAVEEQRFVVLYDTSALRQRETGFITLLSISVLLVTLLSALAGRWLAVRMIAPVNELAKRVSQLNPEDEPTPLAKEFPWIEVRRLALDFDVYLQRLHDFSERERLFTGDVSHELRTPLAIINGATQLLLSDLKLEPHIHKRVMRIARATNSMEEITATLLALAREKGDASSRSIECDVESVAQEVIEQYQTLFQHKSVAIILQVKAPLKVYADHAILSMILGNLLRNALSFTEQGQVIIRIDKNTIQVEDSGPGFDSINLEHLFQPYVQGNQSGSGAGLGLSLVWRLCELANWKVSLSNRPEGGALIELRLNQKVI